MPPWIGMRVIAFMLGLAGCAGHATKTSPPVHLDVHEDGHVTEATAEPEDVADAQPRLAVVGTETPVLAAIRARLRPLHDPGRLRIQVAIEPERPPASGRLHAKVRV